MTATDGTRGARSLAADISTSIVRLMAEYTGRGPTKARTTINGDLIVVLLRDTLTKGERGLAERGELDAVLSMRRAFQSTMRDEASSAIEELTGRRVLAFMSDNLADPDLAVEVFVLEPEADVDHSLVDGQSYASRQATERTGA
jgi:uncharacterized protein YbcI